MGGEELCRTKAGKAFLFTAVLSSMVNIGLKKKVLLYYHCIWQQRKKSDLWHRGCPQSRSKISVAWQKWWDLNALRMLCITAQFNIPHPLWIFLLFSGAAVTTTHHTSDPGKSCQQPAVLPCDLLTEKYIACHTQAQCCSILLAPLGSHLRSMDGSVNINQ